MIGNMIELTAPANGPIPASTHPVNPLSSFVDSQLGRPRGVFGAVVGWVGGRRRLNRLGNELLVDLLDLRPNHRVLEIGSGPGLAVAAAARHLVDGTMVAVDHSAEMVRQTAARNRHAVADGRATLLHLDVAELPDQLTGFDRIWALNVWRYWPDQQAVIDHLARRLKPDGVIVIGHQARGRDETGAKNQLVRARLLDQMRLAGLHTDYRVADLNPAVTFVIGRPMPPDAPVPVGTERYVRS
jgi:SAM-dependent methyltransferase